MKKRLLTFVGGLTLIGVLAQLLVAQESTFLAQKLMLENDFRKRIRSALEKILEDHRYVLDVTVDLEFTPTVREEVTFRPAGSGTPESGSTEAEIEDAPATQTEEGSRRSRVTGIPIPGFDFQIEEEESPETPHRLRKWQKRLPQHERRSKGPRLFLKPMRTPNHQFL